MNQKLENRCLILGALAYIVLVAYLFIDPTQAFQSYLFGYLFWISLSLGCLGILMMHHVVGGGWGYVIRRILESGIQTFWLMLILFIPLLFGLRHLYAWTTAADPHALHVKSYLNIPFFVVRTFIYFAIWISLTIKLSAGSLKQDESSDWNILFQLKKVSAPGLVVYFFTGSFAFIDWALSLDYHWYSTVYASVLLISGGLATFAGAYIWAAGLRREEPFSAATYDRKFYDLGNMILAFLMFWAYVSFCQFLIIWSGNLPEESFWYLNRFHGGWQYLILSMVVLEFAVPFLLLLLRPLKRSVVGMARVAALIFIMFIVQMYWLIQPAFHPGRFHIHVLDPVALIGIGGLWTAFALRWFRGRSVLPMKDPRLQELLSHE